MDDEVGTELRATLEARRELGPAHDAELVAGFVDRIEREIDRRVEQRVRGLRRKPAVTKEELGVAIPLVLVAGIFGGTVGVVAVAVVLAVVFIALTALHR